MDYSFEQSDGIGIYTFRGELNSTHEDKLKMVLMRAIHSFERVVLNFKGVRRIDFECLKLLQRAYCTSVRLRNPVIMTYVPTLYLPDIFNCETEKQLTV